MSKYTKEEKDAAIKEIRTLLRKGWKYHQAAEEVSKHSRIKLTSLRWMARKEEVASNYSGYIGQQHSKNTPHGGLLEKCRRRLERQGYKVISEQNQIRRYMESKGSKGNPDLVAVKGSDVKLVEIVERTKTPATFIDQLQRFCKVGKVIAVFPLDTRNLVVLGKQDLS